MVFLLVERRGPAAEQVQRFSDTQRESNARRVGQRGRCQYLEGQGRSFGADTCFSGRMRATVMYGAGDVRVENVPDAQIIEPTDALVRVTRAPGYRAMNDREAIKVMVDV
jgi:hypothetical protein